MMGPFQLGTETSEINTLRQKYLASEPPYLLVLCHPQPLSEKLV